MKKCDYKSHFPAELNSNSWTDVFASYVNDNFFFKEFRHIAGSVQAKCVTTQSISCLNVILERSFVQRYWIHYETFNWKNAAFIEINSTCRLQIHRTTGRENSSRESTCKSCYVLCIHLQMTLFHFLISVITVIMAVRFSLQCDKSCKEIIF